MSYDEKYREIKRARDRERHRVYYQGWRARHREELREYMRRWWEAHPGYAHERYMKNKEKKKAREQNDKVQD